MLGGSQNDELISVRETPERDGYIVAGYTLSNDIPGAEGTYSGNTDIYVARLDLEGNIVWQKVIGGDKYDFASSAIPASDGGYIVAGYTESRSIAGSNTNHGYTDIVIMKLDAGTGEVVWSKLFGGKYGEATAFDNVIQPTPDGGYVLIGQSGSRDGDAAKGSLNTDSADVWIIKVSSRGMILWTNRFGGTGYDDGTSIQKISETEYIFSARTYSSNDVDVGQNHGEADIWIGKIDNVGIPGSDGFFVWQDVLDGNTYEQCSAIQPTNDEGYILAAFTRSNSNGNIGINHGYEDAWLAKLRPRFRFDIIDFDTGGFIPDANIELYDYAHSESQNMTSYGGVIITPWDGPVIFTDTGELRITL